MPTYRLQLGGNCGVKLVHAIHVSHVENFIQELDPQGETITLKGEEVEDSIHAIFSDVILDESGKEIFYVDNMWCRRGYMAWPSMVRESIRHQEGWAKVYFGKYEDEDRDWGDVFVDKIDPDSLLTVRNKLSLSDSLALVNHSSDGFSWGYSGSGPAQLSLAILFNEFRDPVWSIQHHISFAQQTIHTLPKTESFTITGEEVRHWRKSYDQR